MSEILALTRLALLRHRVPLAYALLYFTILHIGVLLFGSLAVVAEPRPGATVATITLFGSLPLILIAFALFDFSGQADISTASSGYSPWLLRMPIRHWKLAVVPIALKTAWVLAICFAAAAMCRAFGYPVARWFLPSIGLTALGILALAAVWLPVRRRHSRMLIAMLSVVPFYGWFIGCVMVAFDAQDEFFGEVSLDHRAGVAVSWILGVGLYAGATAAAIAAVGLARPNVSGRIGERNVRVPWNPAKPQRLRKDSAIPAVAATDATAAKGSSIRSIFRYEFLKLSQTAALLVISGWLAVVAFCSLLNVSDTAAVVLLFVFSLFPGLFLTEWMTGCDRTFLPPTLAFAPIRSCTLVWTRQCITTLIWFGSLLGFPIAWTVWQMRGVGDRITAEWDVAAEQFFGVPDAGLSVMAAIALLTLIGVVRHATWTVTIVATGRRRWQLYSTLGKFGLATAVFGWFLSHFLHFPNWQAWIDWTLECSRWIAKALPAIVLLRIALVAASTTWLIRSKLVRGREAVALLIGYYVVVGLCSLVLGGLLRGSPIRWWHCAAIIAAWVPFSRIALAPIALASFRHRG